MATELERKRIVDILNAAEDLTIATLRDDGYPQATVRSISVRYHHFQSRR